LDVDFSSSVMGCGTATFVGADHAQSANRAEWRDRALNPRPVFIMDGDIEGGVAVVVEYDGHAAALAFAAFNRSICAKSLCLVASVIRSRSRHA
jgi:hypothetical protein